ncbi:23S ribosomal RNA methyltransferase Erm [Mycobacterium canetti]|nr:23S ribosomal RNA methyltransferase Erm [Mycobacterium canetti]
MRDRLPCHPHTVVGNLPIHHITAMLRRLLNASGWTDAMLLMQWEVARRRAGVRGATMMTAQGWPWLDFALMQRIPATTFRPRPDVDGDLLTNTRRTEPLVDSPTGRTIKRWCAGCSPRAGVGWVRSWVGSRCDRDGREPTESVPMRCRATSPPHSG